MSPMLRDNGGKRRRESPVGDDGSNKNKEKKKPPEEKEGAVQVKVKILDKTTYNEEPKRKREGDAGLDLRSTKEIIVKAGRQKEIPAGLALQMPKGYYGKIFLGRNESGH
jgi:hypothetical protein